MKPGAILALMPRPRNLVAAVLMLGAAACREADLAPLRADLATSAALVCAPPVPRPAHVAPARFVGRAELEGALVNPCEQNEAHSAASPELLELLHQGLAQDTALAGDLRRSRLLLELPKVDLGAVRPKERGLRTAEEALARTASKRCNAAWVGLDRLLLVAAKAQHEAGQHAAAFALCADVVALARDEDLAGGQRHVPRGVRRHAAPARQPCRAGNRGLSGVPPVRRRWRCAARSLRPPRAR